MNAASVAHAQLAAEMTAKAAQEALSKVGIDVIVLKGPHLASEFYDDPSQRRYCDLDLLVKPPAFSRAIEALAARRFNVSPGLSSRRATMRDYYCAHLASPFGVSVELHRAFAGHDRYPVDLDGVFARATPFRLGSVQVLGLGAEDLLLHLCIHMAKSYFRVEKKHVKDIALVMAKRPVEWRGFLDLVGRARCTAGAWYALNAAVEQYGAVVPEHVTSALAPAGLRRWWLDRFLMNSEFPICRRVNYGIGTVQLAVGLALMDRVDAWGPIALKYARTRVQDALLATEHR